MNYKKIADLYEWWFIKKNKKTLFESAIDGLIRVVSILIFPLIWVILYLVSPLLKIKLIFLYRERLGHLIGNTDHFLRRIILNRNKKIYYLIFCYKPCNETVVKLFSRILPVINNEFVFKLMSSFGVFDNIFRQDIPFKVDDKTRYEIKSPYSFSKNEEKLGESFHENMGIKNDEWYVVFHCRDNAYDDIISGKDERYIRMAKYRNADISNYQKSTSFLTTKGGKSIRVGFPVEKSVAFNDNSLFDYSNSKFRSDFRDVWLCAKARFMVSTSNGTAEFAAMFDTPLLSVNGVPIGTYPLARNSIYIPKILCDKNHIALPFSEQLKYFSKIPVAANTYVADIIYSDGLILKENTDEQILNATIEMYNRVNGLWQPRIGYHQRMEQLNECYLKYGAFGVPLSPMGESFLFELEF